MTVEDRFWAKVRKGGPDECWLWTGRVTNSYKKHGGGYGLFEIGGTTVTAHRYSYQLAHPEENIDELLILHSCDRRRCVNPTHLHAGTAAENTAEMLSRGRQRQAGKTRHGNAKLSWPIVEEIRKTYAGKHGELRDLAAQLHVTKHAILAILRRRTWCEKAKKT